MSFLVRLDPRMNHARALLRTGCGLLGIAALAACTTVTVQPGAEGTASVNGVPATRAPVVESSLHSDGTPVAPQVVAETPAASAQPTAESASAQAPLTGFHLQAGTFSNQASAEAIAAAIRSKAPQFAQQVRVLPRGSNWRVVIGPFGADTERVQAAHAIRAAIGSDVVNAAP